MGEVSLLGTGVQGFIVIGSGDLPGMLSQCFVRQSKRVVKYLPLISIELIEVVTVELKTTTAGFTGHPFQTDIGQPGPMIATPNISVYAAEPDLFGMRAAATGFPYGRGIWLTLLVDGQGMVGVSDNPADAGVVEIITFGVEFLEQFEGNAQCANSIPGAEKLDINLPAMGFAKFSGIFLVGTPVSAINMVSPGIRCENSFLSSHTLRIRPIQLRAV